MKKNQHIIIGVIVVILIGVLVFASFNTEQDHEDGHDHDHDHEGTDPHIWLSPENFEKMAEVVYNGLVDINSSEKIGVLVTIVPQAEMVEFIGGENVDVTIMVPAGQDPHTFEPTPEQMVKVAEATAYFKVGSGVEFEVIHMDTILEQNPDLKVFDCSEEITVISFDEHYGIEAHHDEDHDHEHGEDHDHKGETDSDHQNKYYANYQAYVSKLDDLHTNVSNLLQPYDGRSFMVYHPAWGYFGDSYNLTIIAIEDEGKQPGPAGINAMISQAKEENITVVFVAPQFDTSSAVTIADEIDGNVVFANPLMSNYEETITKLSEDMVTGFQNS